MESIKIRNRNTKNYSITSESKLTIFLYTNIIGRIILKLITLPIFSYISGAFLSSSLSIRLIDPFIIKNKINMSDYPKVEYSSFNDFFTRKIIPETRPILEDPNILIAPCDSKLSVYEINEQSKFKIKGSYYSILDLVESDISKEYNNGYAMIYRLDVGDYHRYCYIDDGTKLNSYKIPGVLHTVRPIALNNYNIYKTNQREYTVLNTVNFGRVVHVEVGALLVGKIVNHYEQYTFQKGEEKGYFKFGGSTIVLLFKPGQINIDQDIKENSKEEIETTVKLGEQVGKKIS